VPVLNENNKTVYVMHIIFNEWEATFIKCDVPDVNCFVILVIKLLAHRDVFNQTSK
jgi:hypothetical protein